VEIYYNFLNIFHRTYLILIVLLFKSMKLSIISLSLILSYLTSLIISLPASFFLNTTQFPPLDGTESNWPSICQGSAQSPIDIPSSTSANVSTTTNVLRILSSNYQPISGRSIQNLNNFKFRLDASNSGNLMIIKNNITYSYNISEIHFHILSEHSFNGNSAMLEMHMVHMKDTQYLAKQGISNDPDPNTILVVGVLFNIDTNFNSFIDSLKVETINPVNNVDVSPFVNPNKNYFHYNGGLTTPPCTETVNWVVMEKIETMTRDQMNNFKNIILPLYPYGNWRIPQKINNRPIYYVKNSNNGCFLKFSYLLMLLVFVIFI
jgi:carbonic anhydrase